MTTLDKSFSEIFTHLMSEWKDKKIQYYKTIMEHHLQGEEFEIKQGSDFDRNLIKPYEKFLQGCIAEKFGPDNQIEFYLLNYSYIQGHFKRLVLQFEGSACSTDKTNTILEYLGQYLKNGEFVEFDYTDDVSFRFPKKVFTTQRQIIEFYQAIKQLHYGQPDRYLQFMMML